MKLIKLEVYIIDYDEDVNGKEAKEVIEEQRYPNHCIHPRVLEYEETDIGEWHDDHPLNMTSADVNLFRSYFKKV